MAYSSTTSNPYRGLIGHSPQGYPVYLYSDEQGRGDRFVVVFPNGQAFFSDEQGNPIPNSNPALTLPLALAGAIAGFFFGGPVAGLAGGVIGGTLGALKHHRQG